MFKNSQNSLSELDKLSLKEYAGCVALGKLNNTQSSCTYNIHIESGITGSLNHKCECQVSYMLNPIVLQTHSTSSTNRLTINYMHISKIPQFMNVCFATSLYIFFGEGDKIT